MSPHDDFEDYAGATRILIVNQQPRPSSPHHKPLPTQTKDTQSGEPGAAWKCLQAEVGRANFFSKPFITVGKGGAYLL